MGIDRREFLAYTGKYILLTSAAALAWDFLKAGTPEAAPNYTLQDHWWGFAIDIEKCIGCGNCVRACKTENDVPLESYYFRTWVERYHVRTANIEHPEVDSPNGGYDGFPARYTLGTDPRTSSYPNSATTALTRRAPRSARGRHLRQPRRSRPGGQDLLSWLPLLRAGVPVRLSIHRPTDHDCRQVFASATSDHEGPHHRLLRDLSHRRAHCWGPERPEGFPSTRSCVPIKIQVLKPQMATGAKAYYNGLDGSGTIGGGHGVVDPRRRRVHVSQRDRVAVEHPDRALPVHHRPGGRRVHSRVPGARVPMSRKCGRRIALPFSPRWPSCWWPPYPSSCTSATPSAPSRCYFDPAHQFLPWPCSVSLPLVSDGRAGPGDLARLPQGHRPHGQAEYRPCAPDLPSHGPFGRTISAIARSRLTTRSDGSSRSWASRRPFCFTATSASFLVQ